MHRIGRFVFQGHVWPFPVVDQHRLTHHFYGIRQIFRAIQQKLGLQNAVQNAVYPFRQSILVAVLAVGHRASDAMTGVQALIKLRAVLQAGYFANGCGDTA